jgi:GIY-YIG catalytic domain-containing protein
MRRDVLLGRLAEMGGAPDYSRLASEVLGIRGAPAALARRLVEQALVVEDRREHWRRVGDRVRRDAPPVPGVYVLRDAEGAALYVGKAANLRRRLGAQFADRRWRSLPPAMARVAAVEWEEAGSELEALMREATLIGELQPIVNIQTGAPALDTRGIPRPLVRDVILLVPSLDPHATEIVAARPDGATIVRRTKRDGTGLPARARQIWKFFRSPAGMADDQPLAPLVFSWLAGRGRHTTRLDPHDATSAANLRARLAAVLADPDLFSERLAPLWR